jgi:hypothetical protein
VKFRRIFISIILSFSLTTALSNDAYSEDKEISAAVEVLRTMNEIEYNYQFCRDRAGNYGYKYDYIKYVWELKNRPYLQLSIEIFDNLSISRVSQTKKLWESEREKMLSNRKGIDKVGNGKYCSKYFSELLGGKINKLSIQKQSLSTKLGSIERARILQRNIGMEVGCIKQGFNSDIKNFTGMKEACSCQTSIVVKEMSNEEIDKYLSLASSQNPNEAVQFISKRINMSELQACYEQGNFRDVPNF